jgi:hypothetical protein
MMRTKVKQSQWRGMDRYDDDDDDNNEALLGLDMNGIKKFELFYIERERKRQNQERVVMDQWNRVCVVFSQRCRFCEVHTLFLLHE